MLLLIAGLVVAAPAQGQVQLTRGPYLQEATTSGITLLWQTEQPTAPAVEYRPAETPTEAPWRAVDSNERARSHAITLAGLEPDTLYQYHVRADGALIYEAGSFRTLPPPGADSLNLVIFGDNRTNQRAHADGVHRILAEQPLPQVLIN